MCIRDRFSVFFSFESDDWPLGELLRSGPCCASHSNRPVGTASQGRSAHPCGRVCDSRLDGPSFCRTKEHPLVVQYSLILIYNWIVVNKGWKRFQILSNFVVNKLRNLLVIQLLTTKKAGHCPVEYLGRQNLEAAIEKIWQLHHDRAGGFTQDEQ